VICGIAPHHAYSIRDSLQAKQLLPETVLDLTVKYFSSDIVSFLTFLLVIIIIIHHHYHPIITSSLIC